MRTTRLAALLALAVAMLAAGCQDDGTGGKGAGGTTAAKDAYAYVPRIVTGSKKVDTTEAKFQLATAVTKAAAAADVVMIQDLSLERAWYKDGKLILKATEHRVEAAPTNAAGDWVDDQAQTSLLGQLGSDKFTFKVTSTLYRSTELTKDAVRPALDPKLPKYRTGVLSSSFTVETGEAANDAAKKMKENPPPDYKPTPAVPYDLTKTEKAAAFTWEYETQAALEEQKDGPAKNVTKGHWKIAYSLPAGGPADSADF